MSNVEKFCFKFLLKQWWPFDLVIYASQASEPHIPDIADQKKFWGKIYHTTQFKKDQYDSIVKKRKKVVIVGGSKASCDIALCFHRGGYSNFQWLHRKPYLFWKYETVFHNRSFMNSIRGISTIAAMIMYLVSESLSGWMMWGSGIAVSYGKDSHHNDWQKFHFGILCPKQRQDLNSIPDNCFVQESPCAFT